MLDDLKSFSDELNSITVSTGILAGFKTQDIVNKGDITMWKKYNNTNINTEIHYKNFRTGLEDWNGNLAGLKSEEWIHQHSILK
jgi:hypothetical protein